MDWAWLVAIASLCLVLSRFIFGKKKEEPVYKFHIGDVTLETLQQYCGYDYAKPILLAVRGKVYDVTIAADQFLPGKPLHAYAGKEISRALAKGSLKADDMGSDTLHDLSQAEMERLEAEEKVYATKYDCVGQVVCPKELTLEQLSKYDGVGIPGGPLYLSVLGKVYDVSKGSAFYGPDGMYPFAGKECARALALMSTELSDCNDKVDDLGYLEKDTLRDWIAKFTFKYPVVGKIVSDKTDAAPAGAQ